jgi:ribosomal protein S18 acetylase RimI-like enzyme
MKRSLLLLGSVLSIAGAVGLIAFGDAFVTILDGVLTYRFVSPSPLMHFLASVDGKPVGTASAFVEAGVVGLASVGVRPEFRRREIGSAITLAALDAAQNLGCRLGVLFSSPRAVAMYERIGFRQDSGRRCDNGGMPFRTPRALRLWQVGQERGE